MLIKIYNLKENGMEFKLDFNRFKRVLKILDERNTESYKKIDLVTNKTKKLFLCKRTANFKENIARMDLQEIKGFISDNQ
jgi:hypothetical protein